MNNKVFEQTEECAIFTNIKTSEGSHINKHSIMSYTVTHEARLCTGVSYVTHRFMFHFSRINIILFFFPPNIWVVSIRILIGVAGHGRCRSVVLWPNSFVNSRVKCNLTLTRVKVAARLT